jgi:Zn-finger nucleic acid-binding protein
VASSPICPTCRAALQLTHHDTFDSWVCPNGHGLAATLSELYERAQEDEIHALWAQAKAAWVAAEPTTGRACPMCERLMVSIAVGTDQDEVDEGRPGDGPSTSEVPIDVCVVDQVVWFDVAELELLPADLPDPQPTPEQAAAVADIARRFGDEIVEADAARVGLTTRMLRRLHLSPKAAAAVNPPTRTAAWPEPPVTVPPA